jgi:hypothetical protein
VCGSHGHRKVEGALLPVLPIVLLPLAVLLRDKFRFGIPLATCSLGCGVSCALLNIRIPVAAKRSDFSNRNRDKPVNGFIELATIAFWLLVFFLMEFFGSFQ